MDNQLPKKITKYFRIICALVTIILTCWCIVKLIRNEDVSLVGFVNFNEDEGKPYPSLTICFWNPFLNEALKMHGSGINTSTYSQFLQGELWDERMLSIDYDNVTVSLEDYLYEMGVQYGNFTTRTWSKDYGYMGNHKDTPKFYISNRDGGSKCYTFTLPYVYNVPVISFYARINTDIFPQGIRTPYPKFNGSDITEGGFTSFFHLPGQHFRSYFDKKYSWEDRTNKSKNYDMFYTIKNIEVLKRRNKYSKPCNSDWIKDDEVVIDALMTSVGCSPHHWKINSTFQPCSSREQMKKFKWPSYNELQKILPPCRAIEKLQDDYSEMDIPSKNDAFGTGKGKNGWFRITLYFPETSYKEISQAKAYDIESFVGNAGGYLGLFLGYSLVCIPEWMVQMIFRVKKKQMSVVENRSENSENQISSMMINDIGNGKERTESEIILDRNISKDLRELYTNHKILESKLKDLEKKIQAVVMKVSDSDEIQI